MSDVYVFAYQGYEGEAIIVKANSEAEARGLAVEENHGMDPIGEAKLLDDLIDDGEAVKLV